MHSLGWILVTWGIHAGGQFSYIHPGIFESQTACEKAWTDEHWGYGIHDNQNLKHDCQEVRDQNRWIRLP